MRQAAGPDADPEGVLENVRTMLRQMGYPGSGIRAALDNLGGADGGARAAAAMLEKSHPTPETLRRRVAVTSSRSAGLHRLSDHSGLPTCATDIDAVREEAPDDDDGDDLFPRAHSAPAAAAPPAMWERLVATVRSEALMEDPVPKSPVLAPASLERVCLPGAFRPQAAYAVPAQVSLVLLRVAAAVVRRGAAPAPLAAAVSEGRLQDPALEAVLRQEEESAGEEAPDHEDCGICFADPADTPTGCPHGHAFCRDCLSSHCTGTVFPVCPANDCDYDMTDTDLLVVLGDCPRVHELRAAQAARVIDELPGLVRCPREGCDNAVVVDGERMRWDCGCGHPPICTNCKQRYHYKGQCEDIPSMRLQWLKWRSEHQREEAGGGAKQKGKGPASADYETAMRAFKQLVADEKYKMANVRHCPYCRRPVEKVLGCSSMICGRDSFDKGGGNAQRGCGRSFNWGDATPYVPEVSFQEERLRAAATRAGDTVQPRPARAQHDVLCRNCRDRPMKGVRLECMHCADFNLCEGCDRSKTLQGHDEAHVFRLHETPEPGTEVKVAPPPHAARRGRRAADEAAADAADLIRRGQELRDAALSQQRARQERHRRDVARLRWQDRVNTLLAGVALVVQLTTAYCLYLMASGAWAPMQVPDTVLCEGSMATCACGTVGFEHSPDVQKLTMGQGAPVGNGSLWTDSVTLAVSGAANSTLLLRQSESDGWREVTGLRWAEGDPQQLFWLDTEKQRGSFSVTTAHVDVLVAALASMTDSTDALFLEHPDRQLPVDHGSWSFWPPEVYGLRTAVISTLGLLAPRRPLRAALLALALPNVFGDIFGWPNVVHVILSVSLCFIRQATPAFAVYVGAIFVMSVAMRMAASLVTYFIGSIPLMMVLAGLLFRHVTRRHRHGRDNSVVLFGCLLTQVAIRFWMYWYGEVAADVQAVPGSDSLALFDSHGSRIDLIPSLNTSGLVWASYSPSTTALSSVYGFAHTHKLDPSHAPTAAFFVHHAFLAVIWYELCFCLLLMVVPALSVINRISIGVRNRTFLSHRLREGGVIVAAIVGVGMGFVFVQILALTTLLGGSCGTWKFGDTVSRGWPFYALIPMGLSMFSSLASVI